MRELLTGPIRATVRVLAIGWLLAIAPLELATTLTGLVTGPGERVGAGAGLLVAACVLATALGLVLGRQLLQRVPAHGLAVMWAVADLVTLGAALATDALPSNRVPGAAPLVWVTYAALDGLVVAAARVGRTPAR